MNEGNVYGYWLPVKDEETARYAVRMAGLPTLVVAANAILFALIAVTNRPENMLSWLISLCIGLVMLIVAFRLRPGASGWIPISFPLCGLFAVLQGVDRIAIWGAATMSFTTAVVLLLTLLVPFFCLVLSLGGLRGWQWLKKQGVRQRY